MPPVKKKPSASGAALSKFEEQFTKTFGAGTLVTGSAKPVPYEVISTGSLALDYITGVGGLVEGRLNEFWGPDGIGKTRLSILHLVEAQRKHPTKKVAFIDVEKKWDWKWAIAHGLNPEMTYLYQPDDAEDVADALKDFIRSNIVSAVVVDSIGAMIPEAEKEKDADQAVMAQQAKIVTRMVKIAASEAPKTGVSVVLINQVRANLGYGADTTTSGGFALKHVTTMKMKFKRTGTLPFKAKVNDEDVVVGHEIAIYTERNGVAPAYRTATMVLFNVPTTKYGPLGLDVADETATMGIKTRVINQRGGWYDLPDGSSHNGKPALVIHLRDDPSSCEKVREKVLAIARGEAFMEEIAPEDIPEEVDPEAAIAPRFRTAASIAENA